MIPAEALFHGRRIPWCFQVAPSFKSVPAHLDVGANLPTFLVYYASVVRLTLLYNV